MCACVRVGYVHPHLCTCVCTCVYRQGVHLYTYMSVNMRVWVCIHLGMYLCVCVYRQRCVCMCVCACVYEHGFGCGMATYRSLNLCHAPSLSFQTLPATLPQAASYSFLVYLSLLSATLAGGPFTVSLQHFILMQGCEEGRDSSPICLRSGSLRPQT